MYGVAPVWFPALLPGFPLPNPAVDKPKRGFLMQPFSSIIHPFSFGHGIDKATAKIIVEAEDFSERRLIKSGLAPADASQAIGRARTRFMETHMLCESPIERIMLAALSMTVIDGRSSGILPSIHDVSSGEPWPDSLVVIVPQFVIAKYRLDFLICVNGQRLNRALIAIECDGKDYHSSREQIERDAERERYLVNFGIATLRYGGSDIYRMGGELSKELGHALSHLVSA